MKPAPFDYLLPATLDEAVQALAGGDGDARVLAGGQSLVPMLNMRLATPQVLVDINRLPDLDAIDVDGTGHLAVGALVRQRAAERSSVVRESCPLLARCLPYVGHAATRNRGTVGGSIAHADPAGEIPLALLACGGDVEVLGPAGRRRVAADDLFAGFLTTTLGQGEMVVACHFRVQDASSGSGFAEAAPRHGDFAYASVAAVVTMAGGLVTAARVAVGAAVDRPRLVGRAGAVLVGTSGGPEPRRAAAEAVRSGIEPLGTLHAPAPYQRHLLGVLTERALAGAVAEASEHEEVA
ncbi:MAG: FAD binding domain-containing protein [Acidimicrobiales bacterium]